MKIWSPDLSATQIPPVCCRVYGEVCSVGKKKLVRKAEPPSKRGIAWPRWTGFRGMTVRDWLPIVGALLIPIMVALGTGWITWRQAKLEDQRARGAQKLEKLVGRVHDVYSPVYLRAGRGPLYDPSRVHEMASSLFHLDLRASRRRCVTNRLAAAETATSGISIRRNDQLIRYSPLTTVASTPKAMIEIKPTGIRRDGRSRPRINPMTRPLATGSSSS